MLEQLKERFEKLREKLNYMKRLRDAVAYHERELIYGRAKLFEAQEAAKTLEATVRLLQERNKDPVPELEKLLRQAEDFLLQGQKGTLNLYELRCWQGELRVRRWQTNSGWRGYGDAG